MEEFQDFEFKEELSEEKSAFVMKRLDVKSFKDLKEKYPLGSSENSYYDCCLIDEQDLWDYVFKLFESQSEQIPKILEKFKDMQLFCLSACFFCYCLEQHYKLLFGEFAFDPNYSEILYFSNYKSVNPVEYACFIKDPKMLQFLIDKGGKVTEKGIRSIFCPAKYATVVHLQDLIECLKIIKSQIGSQSILSNIDTAQFEEFFGYIGTPEQMKQMLEIVFEDCEDKKEWDEFLEGNFFDVEDNEFKSVMKEF